MTIKQQGGIFGRNPTFNNVEVEGDLTAATSSIGSTTVTDLTIDGGHDWSLKPSGNNLYLRNETGSFDLMRFNADQTVSGLAHIYDLNGFFVRPYIQMRASSLSSQTFRLGIDGNNDAYIESTNNEPIRIRYGGNEIGYFGLNGFYPADGKGIDFSATSGTGTSELFDDYEEGNWTPVIEGLTSAGAGTYTRQVGWYTKVGNVVHLTCSIIWTAHTGTGIMHLAGLPFSGAYSAANVSQAAAVSVMDFTLGAGNIPAMSLGNSADRLTVGTTPVGGGAFGILSVQSAGTLHFQLTYRAA